MQEKESKTNWHFYFSLLKSGMRFGAAFALILGNLTSAGLLFIAAEVLGVAEEF